MNSSRLPSGSAAKKRRTPGMASSQSRRVAGSLKPRRERVDVGDDDARMRLARRPELRLDAEMDLDRAALDPDAAAFRELRRLLELGHAEHADIEAAARRLGAGRYRDLHVIEAEHRGRHAALSTRAAALPPLRGGLGWGKPRSGLPPAAGEAPDAGSRFARYPTPPSPEGRGVRALPRKSVFGQRSFRTGRRFRAGPHPDPRLRGGRVPRSFLASVTSAHGVPPAARSRRRSSGPIRPSSRSGRCRRSAGTRVFGLPSRMVSTVRISATQA